MKLTYNQLRLYNKNVCIIFDPCDFDDDNNLLDAIALVLNSGIKMIQLNDTVCAGRLLELSIKIKQLCAQYEAVFILRGRVDIAQLSESDGVFLLSDGISADMARKLLGEQSIIGVSANTEYEAENAIKNGADYIVIDSIFSTPDKPTLESVGLEYAKWVSENIYIPAFAQGDIDNCPKLLLTGISRVAVVYSSNTFLSPDTAAENLINLTKPE